MDSRRLIAAVERATGRRMDMNASDDRMALQNGCYILNSWGFGPIYKFDLYIEGPYSRDLADDCLSLEDVDEVETDIPDSAISKLSDIFGKGLSYAEAYTTVLLIKNNSPGASYDRMVKRALELKSELVEEIKEASSYILI